MTRGDVHGPIDFLLIEFSTDRLTGGGAQALLDLVDKGIVALYDVLVFGKADDGSAYALDFAENADQLGGFADLAGVRSGLLTDEEMSRSGRHDAAGHARRADRLREHVGGAFRRRGHGSLAAR